MEKFAIAIQRENSANISMFNTVLFNTKNEARKYREWYVKKMEAERIAHNEFWGSIETGFSGNPRLQVVKVLID